MLRTIRRWAAVSLLPLTFSTIAFADETTHAWKYDLGLDVAASFHYHEPKMKETGQMYGIFLNLDTAPKHAWAMLGELSYFGGHLKYDGQTMSGIPVQTKNGDTITHAVPHHVSRPG